MSTDHLDNENFIDLEKSCPLCMELFDLDDMGFLPCPCGYRICRFCWHRLKTYEDNIEAGSEEIDGSATSGRCPACRKVYSDVPVGFNTDLTVGSMLDQNKCKKKKKRLQNKQKQKLLEEKQKLKEILKREEKSLAGLRVVQKNLVFVIGIPQRNNEELRREFSKFGKIHKLVIGNTNNSNTNTAYVTYTRPEDAIKTIQALNQGTTSLNSQLIINGQSKLNRNTTRSTTGVIKAGLGTTKYCNNWLKDQQCPKLPDCMYLHELADQEASFTKEDMQKGKHADYEKKLIQQYLDKRQNSISDCMSDNLKISNNSESSNSSNVSINNLCLSKNENDLNLNYDDNESIIYMDRKHLENFNVKNEENENLQSEENNHFNHFNLQESENSNKNFTDKNKKKDTCDKNINFETQKLFKTEDSQNSITANKALNVSSLKSNFINIDITKNNKLKMNLIDEIIANSSDSSTSYSTCSSGSNRLNRLTNDINQLNENIISVEQLNSSTVLDKKILNHSPVLNAINNFDDDDLDFDPISISTIGLQDLLKTTNLETPLNPTSSSVAQLNQGSVNPMFAQTSHSQSILNMNSSLTNPNFNNNLHNQNANKQNQVNDRSNLFTSSFNNMNKNFQQTTTNDLTDTWRNSLRALLPNVNITFANNSSSNQNNFIKQQQLNQQVKQQQNLATFTQQNSIKCNQNFVNQLQQQQPQNPQLQQQQQPVYPIAFLQQQQFLRQQAASNLNLPYTNFFSQQQQQQQHKNPVQQLKPSVQMTNINQSNQSGQLQQQHLNNLQRFFSQNFHQEAHQQQPPPGFANF